MIQNCHQTDSDICHRNTGAEKTMIQKLLVFERKILRRIFGPTKENQIWRIKTNEELDKLIKHKIIFNHIKAQRLSWFGHVQDSQEDI